MTEEQLDKIIEALNGIRTLLTAEGEIADDNTYPSYSVADGLVMIAEAIDRNTAAIEALAPELRKEQ